MVYLQCAHFPVPISQCSGVMICVVLSAGRWYSSTSNNPLWKGSNSVLYMFILHSLCWHLYPHPVKVVLLIEVFVSSSKLFPYIYISHFASCPYKMAKILVVRNREAVQSSKAAVLWNSHHFGSEWLCLYLMQGHFSQKGIGRQLHFKFSFHFKMTPSFFPCQMFLRC